MVLHEGPTRVLSSQRDFSSPFRYYYPVLEIFMITQIYKLPFDAGRQTWGHSSRNCRPGLLLFAKIRLGMVIPHAAIWSSTTGFISEGRALASFVDLAGPSEWWLPSWSCGTSFKSTAWRSLYWFWTEIFPKGKTQALSRTCSRVLHYGENVPAAGHSDLCSTRTGQKWFNSVEEPGLNSSLAWIHWHIKGMDVSIS